VTVHINTLTDPRLEDYRNVPDAELLRERGLFVAEGRLVVRRLLESTRFQTKSVLVTPTAREALAEALDRHGDLPVYVVAQQTMNEITGFNIHRGCLAIGERPATSDWTDVARSASLVVVLERVSNADNVGGIFRNAAAFGAEAVLLGPDCADPLYRKAIRTSMGAALRVPFAAASAWPEDLAALRAQDFTLIALTPGADAKRLPDVGPLIAGSARRKIALLLGHEGEGLSADALDCADARVRIPMAPNVDSVNVAAAAGIALYELCRGKGSGAEGRGLSQP